MPNLPIAAFPGPDTVWILIPLSAMAVGAIAILTGHQQRMATIIHGRAHKEAVDAELQALRAKIAELEAKINVQALATASISAQKNQSDDEAVRQRLG